ncbi:hypothetical protein L1049_026859 [Liquidambar formosana]|uniref:Uncharacterized protein n=1 Tax=Liquidambar formosana TaxID=63359 RepID=A0AAP0NH59_LIQFO
MCVHGRMRNCFNRDWIIYMFPLPASPRSKLKQKRNTRFPRARRQSVKIFLMADPPSVQYISECFGKPQQALPESNQPCYLTPWDLVMLSVHYIQKGLLFIKPPSVDDQEDPIKALLNKLKGSLSLTLTHFYPLAGRFATLKEENPPSYSVYIDCNNSPGAKFIHAAVDMTVSEILSPIDVPSVVESFFDHDRAVNHDGHTMPLLSIQVTQLVDGIFIGCSMNHAVADGNSFWNFFNTWSEIFKAQGKKISISLHANP